MRVGFIGLGDIGMPMAQRLVESGFELVVRDLNNEKADRLAQDGASVGQRLSDFKDCEVVCLAVPDDPAVKTITTDPDLLDVLPENAAVLIHSTILPPTASELGEQLKPRGISVHDVPVSGGAGRARVGELTLMVGGNLPPHARTVALAMGRTITCGPIGAGAAVKLSNQLSMLAALGALHEGLALAEHFGATTETVLEVLSSSTGSSWSADNWGFFDKLAQAYDGNGVEIRYRPWSKDLWDFVAAGRSADLHTPLAALLSQIMPQRVEDHAKAQIGKES